MESEEKRERQMRREKRTYSIFIDTIHTNTFLLRNLNKTMSVLLLCYASLYADIYALFTSKLILFIIKFRLFS